MVSSGTLSSHGSDVEFSFRGKSGVYHKVKVHDRRLARIIRRSRDLPGQELFQYIDDAGETHSIDSSDVNDYLRAITGEDYTAKDFRTWSGTVLAALALQEFEKFDSEAQAKKNIVRAIESVAEKLGNTPSVCRKCYVHPVVLDAYLDGRIDRRLGLNTEFGLLRHPGQFFEDMADLVDRLVSGLGVIGGEGLFDRFAHPIEFRNRLGVSLRMGMGRFGPDRFGGVDRHRRRILLWLAPRIAPRRGNGQGQSRDG